MTIKRLDGKDTAYLTLSEYVGELANSEASVRDDRVGELVIDLADPHYPMLNIINIDGTSIPIAPGPTPNAAGQNTEVQFNNEGQLGSSNGFIYDTVTETMSAANIAVTDSVASDLIPIDANALNLGSALYQWNRAYINEVVADNALIGNLIIANMTVSQILNGTTVVAALPNSDITMTANGVPNIVVVSADTGVTVDGNLNMATGNLNITLPQLAIPGGADNQFLRTDGNGNLTWRTAGAGAAGSNTEIQFNLDGNLSADPLFTYDTVTDTLVTANLEVTDSVVGNLEPIDDRIFNIGSPLYYWGNIYTGNITADNATLGNVTIGNVVVTKVANGTTEVATLLDSAITMTANGVANIVVVSDIGTTITGNISLGDLANIQILGGNLDQVITTDGNGVLRWANGAGNGAFFGNGTSNGSVLVADGNINFNVTGISNVLVLTPTGANIRGNLDITSNLTTGNADIIGNLLTGNATVTSRLTTGNANILANLTASNANITTHLTVANANVTGNLTIDGNLTANNATVTANLQAGNANISGNITANNAEILANLSVIDTVISANVQVLDTLTANNANLGNVLVANVTVTDHFLSANGTITSNLLVGNVDVSGNLVANNIQVAFNLDAPNIVSSTNLGAANATFTGAVLLGNIANVSILGGSNTQFLQTDGNGNLQWATIAAGSLSNGTSNIEIPVADGNINLSVGGVANVVVVTTTGINVAGTLNATGNANVANLTTANINAGNLQATGAVTANNIQANANVAANNVQVTEQLTANNAQFTSNITANYAQVTEDIAANNLALTANLSAFEATFTGNANITGNLLANNATVTANLEAGNIVSLANITAVTAAISGNTTTGNIQVANRVTAVTANISGNLTAANANITATLLANVATVTGNLTSGNADLGNLATANFFQGDGGLLSNITPSGIFRGSYSFASTSPVVIGNVAAGTTVTNASIVVITPFDDPLTTLSIGDTADAEGIIPQSYSDPTAAGHYAVITAVQYGAATQLILTITSGTSTQGDGTYSVTYQ